MNYSIYYERLKSCKKENWKKSTNGKINQTRHVKILHHEYAYFLSYFPNHELLH